MGKERISSQEISDYTNINATQIRRDLSGFGKFGKRGVGYNIDSLLGEIRKILRTQGQHNIALIGAGRLGEAIASSPIFAEHGINIAAVFDTDPEKVGRRVGNVEVTPYGGLPDAVRDKNIIVGVLRGSCDERSAGRGRPDRRGRQDHLQLLGSSPRRPYRRRRAHVEPRGRAPLCAVLPSDLRILLWHGYLLGGTGSNVYTRARLRVNGAVPGTTSCSSARNAIPSCTTPAPRSWSVRRSAVCCPCSCSIATKDSRHGCFRN